MKKCLIAAMALALLASAGFAAEQFLPTDHGKYLDVPEFLGNVPDQFIVVLKDNVTVDHQRDAASTIALAALPGFDQLATQFGVTRLRPQFPGSDRGQAAASDAGQKLSRYYKVKFDTGTLDEAMAAYAANPLVDHVEPIGVCTYKIAANDPYYDDPPAEYPYDQWHYWDTYGIDADLAWDITPGDNTVVVGVLDSGVKYDHGDLGGSNPPGPNDNSTNGNIWVNPQEIPGNGIDDDGNGYVDDVIGWDFVESTSWYSYTCVDLDCGGADNDPFDGNGHGTHVAGTIAAITNNGYAVAGIAGGFGDGTFTGTVANGVKIVPCRIGYSMSYHNQTVGVVIMDYIAEAMYYMANLKMSGVNVAAVNCSWGSANSGGLAAACDYLIAQDVMVIVAAGNSNSTSADYLGTREDCMDVGATDNAGAAASFTNYGTWVDIAAPGVGILSTVCEPSDPTTDYIAVFDGTSMACPHVVGVAALLESCDPSLTAADKWSLMVNNTTPYSGSKYIGTGIVNAKLAFDAAGCSGTACDITADFSGTPTTGCAPMAVQFTDLSSGPVVSWSWDFGDGGSSTAQNPSHTYADAGTYTVSLTATSAACQDTKTATGYITVSASPTANFVGSPTSGNAPLTVNFTDQSTGNPTSWSWNFGDGGTSTSQNPSHTYTTAGTYSVTLTVSSVCGSNQFTRNNYISVSDAPSAEMHVDDMTFTRIVNGANQRSRVYVTILDAGGQPVVGATVSGYFNAPSTATVSAVTSSSGVATLTSSKTKSPPADWCFTVTDVVLTGYTYNSGANVVTQGCESGFVYEFANGPAQALPREFGLEQNYPNPFNPTTDIAFSLPSNQYVTLEVFNVAGQRVAVLADGTFGAGRHIVTWDASRQSSGIYLYRLTMSDRVETRKMLLLK